MQILLTPYKGVIFAYISSSPFILQLHYQLSLLMYSFCFADNAIVLIIGTTWESYFRSMREGVLGVGVRFCFLS